MNQASIRAQLAVALAGIAVLLMVVASGCNRDQQQPTAAGGAKAAQSSTSPAAAPSTPATTTSTAATAPAEPEATAATPSKPEITAPAATTPPKSETAAATMPADKPVETESCDGQRTVTVPAALTGQPLADSLLDQWKRNHPEARWVAEEVSTHGLKPPANNSGLLKGDQAKGDTYGAFSQADLLVWARETEKFVAEGSRIFHDADRLGSTVAVSCDMCHPNAANTHPETYPKFQTQLGRAVLLRDMINWCVEHPVRGKKLDPDGPTMRALEAYIIAQRKGVTMDYGKH